MSDATFMATRSSQNNGSLRTPVVNYDREQLVSAGALPYQYEYDVPMG